MKPNPNNNPVTAAEAERMFKFFVEQRRHGAKSATARKFGRAKSTIHRVAKQERWDERVKKIAADVQKSTDKKITKEEITNLKLIRAAKKKIGGLVLKDELYKATVAELIALVRLEEELLQNLPGDGGNDGGVVNVINDNSELVRLLANALVGLKAITAADRGPFTAL